MSLSRRDIVSIVVPGLVALAISPGPALALPQIKALKPGDFLWYPELAPFGPTVVVVSLPEQLAHVYRNGIEIGVSTCSTGTKGKRTPSGVFTILQKREKHFSSTYNNAPMPHMQRLTWQGIALHAGHLPGYPASHGCIRLPSEFAKLLFETTQLGTTVIIADQKTEQSNLVSPGLILSSDAAQVARQRSEKPQKDKSGWITTVDASVASILVSARDARAYLIVDGVMTDSTPIRVKDPARPLGNHLYRLIGPTPDGRSFSWMAFGFRGAPRNGETADRWNDETLRRIEFLDRAKAVQAAQNLMAGTTMLITDFAAGPATRSGKDFTVIVEDKTLKGQRHTP